MIQRNNAMHAKLRLFIFTHYRVTRRNRVMAVVRSHESNRVTGLRHDLEPLETGDFARMHL